MRIKSSSKTLRRKRWIKALDAACRQRVVLDRDGDACQRCGDFNGGWSQHDRLRAVVIQWAHVHTREYYCIRWADENSLALCDRCHKWFDNNKILAYDWFAKKFPERWEMIKRAIEGHHHSSDAWIKSMYDALKGVE